MCRKRGSGIKSAWKTAIWIVASIAVAGSIGTAWAQLPLSQAAPAGGTGAVIPDLAEKAALFYARERWPGSRLAATTPYYAFDGSVNAYAFQFAKAGSALANEAEINTVFLQREKRLDDVRANRPAAPGPGIAAARLENSSVYPSEIRTTPNSLGPSTGGLQAVLPHGALMLHAPAGPEESEDNDAAVAVWRQQVRAAAHDSMLSDQIGTVIIAARYDLYPLLERFDGVAPHIRHQTKVRRLAAVPVTQPNPIARTYYVGAMAVLHEPVGTEPAPLGAAGSLRLVNPINEYLHEISPQQRATLSGRLPAAEPGRWPIPPMDFWKEIALDGKPPASGAPQPMATPTVSILGVPYYHQDDYGANSCGPVASAQALGYWDDNGLGNLVHAGYANTGQEEELIYDLMKAESYSPSIGTYGNQIEPGVEAVSNNDAYGRRLSVASTSYGFPISWTTHIKNEINARRPFVFFNWNTELYPYWAHFVTGMGYNENSGHLLFVNYNYPPDSPYELNWDNISENNQAVYTISRSSTTLFDCPWSDGFESAASSPWIRGSNGSAPYWGRTSYRAHNSTPNPYPPGGNPAWSVYCVRSSVAPPGPYPPNTDSWMIFGPFSTLGKSSGNFSAYIWRHIPESDGGDYVALFASLDGSNFSGTGYWGDHRSWNHAVLDLTSVYGLGNVMNRPNVWVALWFHSDGDSTVGEGAYVDNAAIRLYPVSPFEMITPGGGEQWKRGTAQEIRWRAPNTIGQGSVKIELYRGTSFHSTINTSTANDGSYSWTIPGSTPWASDYKIKISRVGTASAYVFSAPFEIYPDPAFTVNTPNGGQVWQRGTTRYIAWSWAGYPGTHVRIELLKGGVVNRTIAATTPNDGLYAWSILANQTIGNDYRIRIRSATTGSIFDDSNANFSIIDPMVSVVRPLLGDWWMRTKTYSIVWKWTGTPPALSRIELILGSNVHLITDKASNAPGLDGFCHYLWTVPATATLASNYTIRVTGLGGQGASDSSDPFRIVDQESLNLTSPNGGEFWLRGSTHELKWVSTLTQPAQVKIELYKSGTVHSLITAATDNDGSHTWTVPATAPLGSDYRVRIQLTSPSTVYDFSNSTFRIGAPQIVLLWPPARAVLTPGVVQLLQWQSSDLPVRNPHVRIELWRGGLFDSLITSSTADTGTYQWRIPPNLPPGPHFQIRISSVEDPSIEGFSSEEFALANLPAVQLLTPNGSERVQRGSQQVISWRYNGLPATDARVELYRSGQLWGQIARVALADGSVRWAVPRSLPSGRDYKIKITSLFDPTVLDWSDGFFFVEPDTAVNGAHWTLY